MDLTGTTPASLGTIPYTVDHPQQVPATLGPHVLACVVHQPQAAHGDDPRYIPVHLPLLHGPAAELWTSAAPVRTGEEQGIRYAENGRVLFGHVHVPESELAHTDRALFHAYIHIESLLRRHGYPAWLRVWNYVSRINEGEGDQERYRQFVLGRHNALSLKPGFEKELPAATAIGQDGEGMLVYFLAGRVPGIQIENPRQISAFHYPRQYGPRGPSFSRAMLVPWWDRRELLVSGTASVVGHETLHIGHPMQQLEESLVNMQIVLDQAGTGWVPQSCRLYVRKAEDAALAIARLESQFPRDRIVVLRGDICRADLSLEIEATYTAPT